MNKCRLCDNTNISVCYQGPIRTGLPGRSTDEPRDVLQCSDCGVEFLADFYYEDVDYRLDYNDSMDIDEIKRAHDDVHIRNLTRIPLQACRGQIVLDVGSGHGGFLDLVAGMAAKTIAVEPTRMFHPSLQKDHQVYPSLQALRQSEVKADIVCCFTVIEHVEDPVTFLSEIRDVLAPGGQLFLSTPNNANILCQLLPSVYAPFNYRTAHLYYFDENSLSLVFKQAGFESFKPGYAQEYDLSNLLLWMKEGRPTGNGAIDLFDQAFDHNYRQYLEDKKLADLLFYSATLNS